MKIQKHSVVTIHYTLKAEDGSVVDSSVGEEPLNYLAGTGNIIPGLDESLMGLEVGDKKHVVVQPDQGYGAFDEELVQTLPREMFTGIEQIEVGMEFQTQGSDGEVHSVVVTEVSDDEITVDGNHEFAGKVLTFDVSVEAIRAASPEEIDHGHVH